MPNSYTRIYSFKAPDGMPPESFKRLVWIGGIIAVLFMISLFLRGTTSLLSSAFHYIILIPIILMSLTIHEYSHAMMADFLGDPTPSRMGRLSLNPLRHLEFFGTLLLFFTGFGWAKPVLVDPGNFRVPKRAMLSVALAGPLSNFALAGLATALMKLLVRLITLTTISPTLVLLCFIMLKTMIIINISLAIFNLLPFPPLDGSRIISYFLPDRFRIQYRQFEQIAPMILLLLFALGGLSIILSPAISVALQTMQSFFGDPMRDISIYLMQATGGIQL